MSLFSPNLKLIGLGVEDDMPGPGTLNSLPDGIHLRWLFKRHRGFPWHGYYLLRRPAASEWSMAFDFKPTIGNELQALLDSFDDENNGAVYVPLSRKYAPLVVVGVEGVQVESFFQKIGTAEKQSASSPLVIQSTINANDLDAFPLIVAQQLGPQWKYDLYGLSLDERPYAGAGHPPKRIFAHMGKA